MLGRQFAAASAILLNLVGLSAPSYAGNCFCANAPPTEYNSSSWYTNWLISRQSNGGALYNHPCTVSDGLRDTPVPCQIVAIALNGGFVQAGYLPEAPVAAPPCVGAIPGAGSTAYYRPVVAGQPHVRVAYHRTTCRLWRQ
jgi:hypothetical protein